MDVEDSVVHKWGKNKEWDLFRTCVVGWWEKTTQLQMSSGTISMCSNDSSVCAWKCGTLSKPVLFKINLQNSVTIISSSTLFVFRRLFTVSLECIPVSRRWQTLQISTSCLFPFSVIIRTIILYINIPFESGVFLLTSMLLCIHPVFLLSSLNNTYWRGSEYDR